MVDAERLHRILRRVTNDLAHLRTYEEAEREGLLRDRVRMGDLKYLFITVIEGCIDAAQHICAARGYGPPEDNGDAVRLLGEHGVLAQGVASRIATAVGFRNLLVHRYAQVDDGRVVDNLQHLDDLDAYVDGLTELLDGSG